MCGPTTTTTQVPQRLLVLASPNGVSYRPTTLVLSSSILPPSLNMAPEPSTRRVRFAADVTVQYHVNSSQQADDDTRHLLWYHPQDLYHFKQQAKKQALANTSFPDGDDIQESKRGLESCTYERQFWIHQTVQAILSAHKKGMSCDDTALVSRACTAWNEEIAFMQACHDYCSVYQPTVTLPQVSKRPPRFPFEMKRSRVNHAASDQLRQVKCRTV